MKTKIKTAILIPGTTGLYSGAFKIAKSVAKNRALVTSRYTLVEALLKRRQLTKVIILMGSKNKKALVSVPDTYFALRAADKKVKLVAMDGWNWGSIPRKDMILLTGGDATKTLAQQL
jgi:hypothetical protein